jgi:DnaJ-domain-containing protein 1
VDRLFDRLSSLIRSLMTEDGAPRASRPADPDLAAAMDELDEFLSTGKNTERPEPHGERRETARPRSAPRSEVPEDIVKAYRNLELSPAATTEQIRASYRRLMRTYHPDKHTGDVEKQRIATEITQHLTESFIKIREYRARTS